MMDIAASNGPQHLLISLALVGTRISTIFVFAPFLGGNAIPARIKVALTVALTAIVFPLLSTVNVPASVWDWGHAVTNEFLTGLALGLTFQFVIEAVEFAGQMLGLQMGFSLVNVIDPQTQVDTPVLSIFHQLIAILIFLQLNVHHWMLRALIHSFEYLPPGRLLGFSRASAELVRLAGGILLFGLQISAPALIATMAIDVVLAFIAKASPQLPALMVGLSLKNIVGLLVLMTGMLAWPRLLEGAFTSAVLSAERLLNFS